MAEITDLLERSAAGDEDAARELVERAYPELRRIARGLLRPGRSPSLAVTELVQELYLRLAGQERTGWKDRGHFYAVAAMLTRRILVDRARRRARVRHGGDLVRVPLADAAEVSGPNHPELIALDEALARLARIHPTAARLVDLRYFGGLSVEEAAEAMGIGRTTAVRTWAYARSWLRGELENAGA